MNHKKPSTMTLLFASLMLAVMQIGCESRSRPEATESAFDRVLDAKTLRVAYISYPPSFIKDANTGEFSGIFHEVLADIAKRLDLKVEYVEETAWGTMIETVKSGRADIVCTGIWPNSTRAKFVDFTDAIYFSPIKAYVRKGNSAFDGNRSAIDSPEVTIATIDGEMTSIIASSDFPKAKTQSHPQTTDIAQMLLEVASGKAAITFVEPAVAAEFAKANPDAIQEVEGIPPLRVFPNVMMVAKGEARLLSTLNIALAEASSIGVIDRVVSKYESNPGLFFRRSSPYREVQP